MRQIVSRLTAQQDEQRRNGDSNAPIPESALNPPATPALTPNPGPTPGSGSMQGQMCAALGGPEGMAAMAEAMQAAFCKHAHKARPCY